MIDAPYQAAAICAAAMADSPTIVLSGPQRHTTTLGAIAAQCAVDGPVALITAGWRERETEDAELRAELGREAINLELYGRWRDVSARDPEYFDLHRARQDKTRELQQLYRRRLAHLAADARQMLAMPGDDELLEPERESAVGMIARLDAHHLGRIKALHTAFESSIAPGTRPVIAEHREEIVRLLSNCQLVCIAGGHVAVLLNRLRLFGLRQSLERRTVIAWSAGAMALTSRVLLFHDFPPWGDGHAEMLDHGLGLCPGVVALPHASRRVALDNRQRVSLLARRMAPATCLALSDGQHAVMRDGEVLSASAGVQRLDANGDVTACGIEVAA